MKNERLTESTGDDDGIFSTGHRPDQITNNYQSTWGLKVHDVRQAVTESIHAHLQVYEVGSVFVSRFPHYLSYLTEEANLMIYTVSVDIETDAQSRPVGEFLQGLKQTVTLARQAYED